jgi:hypothetical protein
MRWTYRRKAAVVRQVNSGAIPRAEALARYDLSEDELTEWEYRFTTGGAKALTIKKRRESDSSADHYKEQAVKALVATPEPR